MAYVLDEKTVRKNLPVAFNESSFYLQREELTTNRFRIESASFTKEHDLVYQVSGLIKVSIKKEDGLYEDLYSYTTKITVNNDDEIESCEKIYLYKLQ